MLARDLQNDPALQQRADELKEELLSHTQSCVGGRGRSGGTSKTVSNSVPSTRTPTPWPRSPRRPPVAGERLATDTELADSLDHRLAHLVGSAVEGSKGEVGNFIATTVQRWDSQEASERIELQVGRDLQFIRINGTIVGGLAGLLIYTLSRPLRVTKRPGFSRRATCASPRRGSFGQTVPMTAFPYADRYPVNGDSPRTVAATTRS